MGSTNNKNASCKCCGIEYVVTRNCRGTYCDNKCQMEFQRRKYIERWQSGLEKGWSGETRQISYSIRKYLLDKYKATCIKCGWNEIHPCDGKPLVEINHIDGDAENCVESNLEVLCPNCHSKTPNFRNRNKGSKRNRKQS